MNMLMQLRESNAHPDFKNVDKKKRVR
jgi:hypothetical protein